MAIAFFAAGTAYEPSAGAASHPIPTPASVPDGAFMVACLIMPNLTTTLSPPAGEGWIVVLGSPNAAPSALREFAWYKFADASEPSTHSFTVDTGTPAVSGRIFAYTGVDTTTPLDVTPTTTNNTASLNIQLPAITPVTSGAWVLRYVGQGNGTTAGGVISAPSGHTDRGMWNFSTTLGE